MSATDEGLAGTDREPQVAHQMRLENVGKAYGGVRALKPTTMTFRQGVFESVAQRDGHQGGWSSTFDRLAEYVSAPPHD